MTPTLQTRQSLHELADSIADAAGKPCVPVLDYPWMQYAWRHSLREIDFFELFSNTSGDSIGLMESLVGIVPLYWIPRRVAHRFVAFVETIACCRADGAIVTPIVAPPAREVTPAVGLDDIARCCHIIRPLEFPADHPNAQVFRMRHRDVLGPWMNGGQPVASAAAARREAI